MPAPDLEARIAALEAAKAAIERELALLGAPKATEAASPTPSVKSDEPEWGTIGEASGLFQRSAATTAKKVAQHGLGVYEEGRWRVDLRRVRAHLSKTDFQPLEPFPQRDSRKLDAIRSFSQ